MIARLTKLIVIPLAFGAGACTTNPAVQHEVACVGGTLSGAVIGGAIGNRFGGGRGQSILTGAGAIAGAGTAATALNC